MEGTKPTKEVVLGRWTQYCHHDGLGWPSNAVYIRQKPSCTGKCSCWCLSKMIQPYLHCPLFQFGVFAIKKNDSLPSIRPSASRRSSLCREILVSVWDCVAVFNWPLERNLCPSIFVVWSAKPTTKTKTLLHDHLQRIDLDFNITTVKTFSGHDLQNRTNLGDASNCCFRLGSMMISKM